MTDRNALLIPAAILIGGALLAVAIYMVRSNASGNPLEHVAAVRPVSPDDHMIGNPEAPVIIVEYSDIDCPFCKDFQATLSQLMSEYGPTGKVAWVYRHLPLINLHPDAALHAEAAECVAEQGDDEMFFRFIDALHQAAPENTDFDPDNYGSVVSGLGLDSEAFVSCIESDRNVERVTQDFENGVAAGGEGTPYTVILIQGEQSIPITGAVPYDAMKQVIEEALRKAGE